MGWLLARRVAWFTPQVLLPLLLLGFALLLLLFTPNAAVPPAPTLLIEAPSLEQRLVEVAYVVVDAAGLERPGFADAWLERNNEDPHQTLNASLFALVADLTGAGAWPRSVPAPSAYLIEIDRRRLAVVDVAPLAPGETWPTELEWMVVRSIDATARRAALASDVRITVAGMETASLWGKIALPSGR